MAMHLKKSELSILSTCLLVLWAIYYLNSNTSRVEFGDNAVSITTTNNVFAIETPFCQQLIAAGVHDMVLLITSYVGHVELRSAHRRAYSEQTLLDLGIKRVFLIAAIPASDKSISPESIDDENRRFHDFVQGDFVEAYRNLTLKHLMGLKWASTNCPRAKYIIKLDDDIVFDIHRILNYLKGTVMTNSNSFLMGFVMRGMKPVRLKENKWYVTIEEYPKLYYPPFVSGWMYITTPKTARLIANAAKDVRSFWIDDVFVTGILTSKIGIKLTDLRYEKLFLEYYELLDCCLNDMVEKKIWCEYGVGPNGNNFNMIFKFVRAIEKCHSEGCVERPANKSLNDTCVSVKTIFPIKYGNPEINVIKLR